MTVHEWDGTPGATFPLDEPILLPSRPGTLHWITVSVTAAACNYDPPTKRMEKRASGREARIRRAARKRRRGW